MWRARRFKGSWTNSTEREGRLGLLLARDDDHRHQHDNTITVIISTDVSTAGTLGEHVLEIRDQMVWGYKYPWESFFLLSFLHTASYSLFEGRGE